MLRMNFRSSYQYFVPIEKEIVELFQDAGEYARQNSLMLKWEARFKISAEYYVALLAGFVSFFLFTGIRANIFCHLITYPYPFFKVRK